MALQMTQVRFVPALGLPTSFATVTFTNHAGATGAAYEVQVPYSAAEIDSKTYAQIRADALAQFQADYPNLN